MWLATKEAARRKMPLPPDNLLRDQLGVPGTIAYKRLVSDFPEVERGPDEPIHHHFTRLKKAKEDWLAEDPTERERRAKDPRALGLDVGEMRVPTWAREFETRQVQIPPVKPPITHRNPGWYTSPESESAGYGVPPMDKRTPGESLGPTRAPGYAPKPQSMDDWFKWLADKGITLDENGQVPGVPQRNTEQSPSASDKPLMGHDIWQEFVEPTTPESSARYLRDMPGGPNTFGKSWRQRARELFNGRRSNVVVAGYINSAMIDMGSTSDVAFTGWDEQ